MPTPTRLKTGKEYRITRVMRTTGVNFTSQSTTRQELTVKLLEIKGQRVKYQLPPGYFGEDDPGTATWGDRSDLREIA